MRDGAYGCLEIRWSCWTIGLYVWLTQAREIGHDVNAAASSISGSPHNGFRI